ncbi:hypothetical protein RAO30_07000, partial [Pediococcus acidilactici]
FPLSQKATIMPGFGIMVAFWLSGNILTFGVRLLLSSRQRTKIIFPKILSLKRIFGVSSALDF